MKNKTEKWIIAKIKLYLKLKYIEDLKNLFESFVTIPGLSWKLHIL